MVYVIFLNIFILIFIWLVFGMGILLGEFILCCWFLIGKNIVEIDENLRIRYCCIVELVGFCYCGVYLL